MTESKLNPFDAELLVMIGDIAKSQPEVEEKPDHYEITVDTTEMQEKAIEALKQAVAGRLGDRLLVTHTLEAAVIFNVEYDPTEYPEQIRTRLVEPDATAGTRYCRTLLEVDAIQVRRDNLDDLLRFTGGGTMTIPRTPNGRAVYLFPDNNGIFIDAPETYYIIREPDGRLTTRPEREFTREFEPKGVSVPKEPGDKGCGGCANFTNEDVNGNGYCEASKLRDNWHGAKKPEAFDVPKEVQAVAEFFGKMFPGSKVEISWSEMPKRNPRDKRRAKGERKGGNNGKK